MFTDTASKQVEEGNGTEENYLPAYFME